MSDTMTFAEAKAYRAKVLKETVRELAELYTKVVPVWKVLSKELESIETLLVKNGFSQADANATFWKAIRQAVEAKRPKKRRTNG